MTVQAELPSVKDLFRESSEAFKKSALNIVLLSVVSFIIGFVLFLIIALIGVALGMGSVLKPDFWSNLSPSFFMGLGLLGLLLILLVSFITSAVQIGMLIAVGKYEERPSIGQLLSQSFRLVIPVYLTQLLLSVVFTGGFFCFFFPIFVLAIIFGFTLHEVVLGNQRFLSAMKGSYRLVVSNFGDILVRALLVFGISVLLWLFLTLPTNLISALTGPAMAVSKSGWGALLGIQMSLTIFQVIINSAWGLFSFCYWGTLYKQLKRVTDETKPVKLWWVGLITIIGWLMMILIFTGIAIGAKSLLKSDILQNLGKNNLEQNWENWLTPTPELISY